MTSADDVVEEGFNGDISEGADAKHDKVISYVASSDFETGVQGDIEDGILGSGTAFHGNALDNTLTGRDDADTLIGDGGESIRGGTDDKMDTGADDPGFGGIAFDPGPAGLVIRLCSDTILLRGSSLIALDASHLIIPQHFDIDGASTLLRGHNLLQEPGMATPALTATA